MIVESFTGFGGIKAATFPVDIARLRVSSWIGVKYMKTPMYCVVFASLLSCAFLALNAQVGPLLFLGIVAILGLSYRRARVLRALQVPAPVSIVFRRSPGRRRPKY